MPARRARLTPALLLAAAACAPAAQQAAAPAVDTAAVFAGLDSLRARYVAAELAGEPGTLAALYTEDATLDFYGAPRTQGRANLQTVFGAVMAATKTTRLDIVPAMRVPRSNESAGEYGDYHSMADSSGAVVHAWGRYAGSYSKGSDGAWRLAYLIAFPDSTRTEKK